MLTHPQRLDSPVQALGNENVYDEEDEEDDEHDAGLDARSDDVISLTDRSSPDSHRYSSPVEDTGVARRKRLKPLNLHNTSPLPRAKRKKLAPIFTNPGRQTVKKSGITIKLKHISRSSRPKHPPKTKRTKFGPQISASRRHDQIRSKSLRR